MLALPAQLTVSGRRQTVSPLALLSKYLVGVTSILLVVIALGMLIRRVSGAFVQPLHFLPLFFTALTLAAYGAAVRYYVGRQLCRSLGWWKQIAIWCPMIVFVLIAVSISLPGTSWIGFATLWFILGFEELVSITVTCLPFCKTIFGSAESLAHRVQSENPQALQGEVLNDSSTSAVGNSRIPENVSHQLTYTHDVTGDEVVYGQVRAKFAPGERNTSVHLAFCPPFGHVPHISVQQIDGPASAVKPSQVLPYGLKLDLKLNKTTQHPESIVIEFHARAAALENSVYDGE